MFNFQYSIEISYTYLSFTIYKQVMFQREIKVGSKFERIMREGCDQSLILVSLGGLQEMSDHLKFQKLKRTTY